MRHYLFGAANQREMAYAHEAIHPLQAQIRRALYYGASRLPAAP